jgi:predicted DNA-binding transcriptional regulator YafY
MARSERQKLKLLYLRDYLLRNTDEQHPVTMKQMIAYLDQNDIPAERKSIYTDIELLRTYGMDIIQESGNYYVGSRYFELPELKLLVDSVQSSKFITYKKTGSLIKKIEEMASIYEAQLLNRQVYVTNRIKSMNESIYYNVDEIHNGIAHNRKIRFHYFEYDIAKKRIFRKAGISMK